MPEGQRSTSIGQGNTGPHDLFGLRAPSQPGGRIGVGFERVEAHRWLQLTKANQAGAVQPDAAPTDFSILSGLNRWLRSCRALGLGRLARMDWHQPSDDLLVTLTLVRPPVGLVHLCLPAPEPRTPPSIPLHFPPAPTHTPSPPPFTPLKPVPLHI